VGCACTYRLLPLNGHELVTKGSKPAKKGHRDLQVALPSS